MSARIKKLYNFSFYIKNRSLALFTHLKLFDAQNLVVEQGYNNLSARLEKGLYMLRIELNDFVEDRYYRLDSDRHDSIDEFNLHSSIPIAGFSSTRPKAMAVAEQWSKFSTVDDNQIGDTSFFLFLSFDNEANETEIAKIVSSWKILSAEREVVHVFTELNSKFKLEQNNGSGLQTGSFCFSSEQLPGQYYLLYDSPEFKREMPFFIFNGFQTQIFMRLAGKPLFGTARISISDDCFDASDDEYVYLDALTAKILNGLYVLPEILKSGAANGKWKNPMLGILASYMYLMTKETSDDNLFMEILGNLEVKILKSQPSPDIIALRILRAKHFNIADEKLEAIEINAPTMLSLGMSLFLDQANKDSQTVLGDQLEQIFPLLQKDSIWTTYEPLPIAGLPSFSIPEVLGQGTNKLFIKLGKEIWKTVIGSNSEDMPSAQTSDWLSSSIVSQLVNSNENSNSLDIAALAQQLQVTTKTIKNKLDLIQQNDNVKAIAKDILGEFSRNTLNNTVKQINNSIDNLLKTTNTSQIKQDNHEI